MDTEEIRAVVAWIRTTDLLEVEFKEGGRGFSLSGAGAPPAPVRFPVRPMVPVTAQTVGIFRSSEAGKARLTEEGKPVGAGDVLGLIETGLGRPVPVASPCAGLIHRVLVESGAPAQYGQPLFFIEPK